MMSSNSSKKMTLASTACKAAVARARESERADRLFHDPWAGLLAGQVEQDLSGHFSPDLIRGGDPGIVIRTKFFDDFLLHAVAEHQIRQVIIIAAGMDTRAFRLVWPEGTHLFELDQPELLAQKEQLLSSAGASPTCWRQTLEVDLRDPWADILCQAGFDPRQRSVWLLEGFLYYLPASSALHVIDVITGLSVSESRIGFNVINRDLLTSPKYRSLIEALQKSGIPWISAMDEPEVVLAERGWSATVTQIEEEGAKFGRLPGTTTPRSVPGVPRSFLVTATRMAD
jgi:methyltransferase (TIGR00027 family)